MRVRILPFAAAVLLVFLAQACGGPESDEKETAREVPRLERDSVAVSLLGEGVISTEAAEFGASFTPSGDTLYFGRSASSGGTTRILYSVRDAEGWSEPRAAPFSGEFRDMDPFVAPGGERLYFSSDRPGPVGAARINTWWVDRTAGGWSEPRSAGPPLNSSSADVFVSATRAGTVYFGSRRGGSQQVYRTEQTADGWARPVSQRFGQVKGAGQPMIAPDGSFILLTNLGPGDSPDLYVSCRTERGWSSPQLLPLGVNTDRAEYAPALDPRDGSLVFASERREVELPPDAEVDSERRPGDLYRADYRPAERCD